MQTAAGSWAMPVERMAMLGMVLDPLSEVPFRRLEPSGAGVAFVDILAAWRYATC